MESKNGFFRMKGYVKVALIVFVAVSLFSYTPMVVNTMIAGLSANTWLLSALALAVPVFCIIVGFITERK
jgi:surface polysaccharide O-acyltransferase-like enzyme